MTSPLISGLFALYKTRLARYGSPWRALLLKKHIMKNNAATCKNLLVNYCICVAVLAGIVASIIITAGHRCKWPYCPYKGVRGYEYKRAVLMYTGQPDSTAAYRIDLLHLEHPGESYTQLEYRLLRE